MYRHAVKLSCTVVHYIIQLHAYISLGNWKKRFAGQAVAMWQGAYKGPNDAIATAEATHARGLPDMRYVVENAHPAVIAAVLLKAGFREGLIHHVIARLNFDYKLFGVMKFHASWRAVGTATYYYNKDLVFEDKSKSLEFCDFEQAPDDHYGESIIVWEDFGVACLHETYCDNAARLEASNAMALTVNDLLKSKNRQEDSCRDFITEMPVCNYMAKFEKMTTYVAGNAVGEFDK